MCNRSSARTTGFNAYAIIVPAVKGIKNAWAHFATAITASVARTMSATSADLPRDASAAGAFITKTASRAFETRDAVRVRKRERSVSLVFLSFRLDLLAAPLNILACALHRVAAAKHCRRRQHERRGKHERYESFHGRSSRKKSSK